MDEKLCAEPGCTEIINEGEFCEKHRPLINGSKPSSLDRVMDLQKLGENKLAELLEEVSGRDDLEGLEKSDLVSYLEEMSKQQWKEMALKRYEYLISEARRMAKAEKIEREKGVKSNAKFYIDIEADPHSSVIYKVLREKKKEKKVVKKRSSLGPISDKVVSPDAPLLLFPLLPFAMVLDVVLFIVDVFSGKENIRSTKDKDPGKKKEDKIAEIDKAEVVFRGNLGVPRWVSKELGGA